MPKYPLTGTGTNLRLEAWTLDSDVRQLSSISLGHAPGVLLRHLQHKKKLALPPEEAMECGKRPVSWIQGGGGPSPSFLGGRDRLVFSSLGPAFIRMSKETSSQYQRH
ncbi:unnamed protein product [Fusarium venenatum]|uniref:Uncharacterized protein n=1 Tax=Fusarium venenatum TaxID=56646 RepID=A0A2L2SMU6_9HYPO|nr:LOW QUALITY PROTEIN: uncharacterized protein FVRRES_11315 [Fusarium venenatum]CEI38624.1 unnamed protein product [Fusarium venenatum]